MSTLEVAWHPVRVIITVCLEADGAFRLLRYDVSSQGLSTFKQVPWLSSISGIASSPLISRAPNAPFVSRLRRSRASLLTGDDPRTTVPPALDHSGVRLGVDIRGCLIPRGECKSIYSTVLSDLGPIQEGTLSLLCRSGSAPIHCKKVFLLTIVLPLMVAAHM